MNNWCVTCKEAISDKHCYRCGKKSIPAVLKCPHCRACITVLAQFCGECGKPVQEAVQEHLKKVTGEGGGKSGTNGGTNAG